MDVEIAKKKFKLDKVSIYISELYSELAGMAYGYHDIEQEINDIGLEYEIKVEECDSILERKKIKLKMSKAIKEATKKGPELTKKIYDKRFEVLKEILELNGYEYEHEFWLKKASVEDVNDILVELVGGGSKKKLSST